MSTVSDHYPKVLLVYHMLVSEDNPRTQHLVAWFKDWPGDCLAQICTGETQGQRPFAKQVYRLGAKDRWFGALMRYHRARVLREAGSVNALAGQNGGTLRLRAARWILRSGLWELAFPIRLSSALKSFVSQFKPDVLYVQGYLLGLSQLALRLREWRLTPICFHTADDWPAYLYADSLARQLLRPVVKRISTRLVRQAESRIAFTRLMKQEYEARYSAPFHDVIGPVAAMDAGAAAEPIPSCPVDCASVVYAGSLQRGRWRSAVHMARAARALRKQGLDVAFVCYSLDAPRDAVVEMRQLGTILNAPVPIGQIPGILRGAGILFLPESFDQDASSWISLSLSSKVPFYIAARRPILIYGPPFAGIVRHAQTEGWGRSVIQPSVDELTECLRQMVADPSDCVHHDVLLSQYDVRGARTRMLENLRALECRTRATRNPMPTPNAS